MKRTTQTANLRNKLYIGIDNGVTGSIGAIYNNQSWFIKTPVKPEQNYTKKKGNINRVQGKELLSWFCALIEECSSEAMFCLIERPMVNPGRWAATVSALRALEATLIIVEQLGIPYQYIDSKEWQRELLPRGSKGDQLKSDSKDIGIRLFPKFKDEIVKQKDADGILMAEYCRRKF